MKKVEFLNFRFVTCVENYNCEEMLEMVRCQVEVIIHFKVQKKKIKRHFF